MSNLTFSELLNQAFQLYKDKEYAQALDLVNREFPHFPEKANRLYFWRACLESLTGQTDLALDTLEEAVEAGYWYNEGQLREDSDLDPLQGLPKFEGLVEICLERQVTAQAEAAPSLITLEPRDTSPSSGPPWPSLLVLHGNNSNAAAAAEYWEVATSLGWLVALPGSSQVVGPDAYGWNDWEWAKSEIQTHLAVLREKHSIDEACVVLGGFSMGGGLAAWLGLSGAIQARGFVLAGPWVPDMGQLVPLMERDEARRLRGYIMVGEEDEVCHEVSMTLAEQLRAHEVPCKLEVYPELAHEHPPEFEKGLARALEYILQD